MALLGCSHERKRVEALPLAHARGYVGEKEEQTVLRSIHLGAGRDDSHSFFSENLTTDFLARRSRSRMKNERI